MPNMFEDKQFERLWKMPCRFQKDCDAPPKNDYEQHFCNHNFRSCVLWDMYRNQERDELDIMLEYHLMATDEMPIKEDGDEAGPHGIRGDV